MRLIEVEDKRNACYLLGFGDLHVGSPQSDLEKFEGYMKWAKEEKAHLLGMGDLFDMVVIGGLSSPFGATMRLPECKRYLKDRLWPVKDLIIGMLIGNHCLRLVKYADCDLIEDLCYDLGVPYCGFSAAMRIKVGHTPRKKRDGEVYDSTRISYIGYAHHTTGGGATPGGKLNRVAKLAELFEGADFYMGAHNHMEIAGVVDKYRVHVDASGEARLRADKVFLVDTGSFLKWDGSYAEQMMLPPGHTGCPRIRLDGCRKDIHVSQ
jgi:hypothetical protein